jgi:hypothetical protein
VLVTSTILHPELERSLPVAHIVCSETVTDGEMVVRLSEVEIERLPVVIVVTCVAVATVWH